MATQISELAEARMEILALMAEFTSRVDRGEPIGHLFQEMAVYSTPRGETRGREAIATLFGTIGESRRQVGHVTRHSNMEAHVIRLSSTRFEARSLLMAIALEKPMAATGSLLVGDHVDIIERESDGAYRFVQRTLKPMLEFSLLSKKGATP